MGQGLVHLHQGRTDVFGSADGLSSDYVLGLFEDREGDIWTATKDGLDRFRDYVVPTISFRQGLSGKFVGSVLVAKDGSVWLSTPDGLDRWDNGQITIYRKRLAGSRTRAAAKPGVREVDASGLPDNEIKSLYQDRRGRIWVTTVRGIAYFEDGRFVPVSAAPTAVYNIAETKAGDLWINDYYRGLLRVVNGALVEQISWDSVGRKDTARAMVADPVDGGLWLGFFRGGLAYFRDGRVRAWYAAAEGLGNGMVGHLRFDREGALWAATEGGLSRLKNGRITTLTSKNGLPCDSVQWTAEDDAQSVWLNTECGLLRVARSDLEAWIVDSHHMVSARIFQSSDGVRSNTTGSGYSPRVAKSPDGKLWFVTYDGASVIDPRNLLANKLPPPVHIEQIIADRKTYAASNGRAPLRLPPLVRDLGIDYTALSLVVPERVRFRYKLEGRDGDWRDDMGNSRRAVYSDLPPRHYRFRVMASNNSGLWNEAGASLDFSIDPAYYQTAWFKASCVAAFLGLLWALYWLRLRQIAQEINARLEERVNERTRIARELHDTLLQSFHGLMFRLQAARNMFPRRPAEAIEALDGAITRAEQAIAEGRGAIQDLRAEPAAPSDLAHLLTAMGKELAGSEGGNGDSPAFGVTVEGAPQTLDPILQDEIYRIAREALRNAFRHARAGRIEAEIRYDERGLRLRIRDDGKGIDPELLKAGGRSGHWGLTGLRERAKRIGAQVDLWSEAGAGTEVQLTVPASLAYAPAYSRAGRVLLQAMRHRLKAVLPKKEDA
jgi:signal transduction histidine kinase